MSFWIQIVLNYHIWKTSRNKFKKHPVTKNLFLPFNVWINCSSDLKNFANSFPSASNFKKILEHFFLTVGQNNFGNKIPNHWLDNMLSKHTLGLLTQQSCRRKYLSFFLFLLGFAVLFPTLFWPALWWLLGTVAFQNHRHFYFDFSKLCKKKYTFVSIFGKEAKLSFYQKSKLQHSS